MFSSTKNGLYTYMHMHKEENIFFGISYADIWCIRSSLGSIKMNICPSSWPYCTVYFMRLQSLSKIVLLLNNHVSHSLKWYSFSFWPFLFHLIHIVEIDKNQQNRKLFTFIYYPRLFRELIRCIDEHCVDILCSLNFAMSATSVLIEKIEIWDERCWFCCCVFSHLLN